MLVLAHALPTRISPHIASPIVTFLSSLSNSTSGVLTTSVLEYAVLIVVPPPSIYIGPMWRREMWKIKGSELSCKSLAIYAFLVKYNKYEERDRDEMEKSTNTIANLIIVFREIANLIAHTTV